MPRQERSIRVEAVVLRHSDWGEADRLLSLYTREAGKVRAIAKGARKVRSRKAGHLEPFTRVQLQLARGHDLFIVTQADTVDAYQPVREDLTLTGYAAYAVELLDRFTYEEGENSSLYRLLVETLERLAGHEDAFLSIRYYEVRLLDVLGFRPQLFQCVVGGETIQAEDQYFSSLLGGVVCPHCAAQTNGIRPVSVDALRYLRHFQRSTFRDAARAQLTPQVSMELETLMQYYLTYLLERGLNTPSFIREVRKY